MIVVVAEEGKEERYLEGVEGVVTEFPNQVRLIRSSHDDAFVVINSRTRVTVTDG